MAHKALRIKGTNTIIRWDKRYASQDRFEEVDMHALNKAKPKASSKPRTTKKKVTPKPAEKVLVSDDEPDLEDLMAGIDDGEEDNR